MKTLSLFFITLLYNVTFSQAPTIAWQRCLGGIENELANSIRQTSDNGYIVSGISHSNDGDVSGNHGNNDAWVAKLNQVGIIEWQKCLGGSLFEWVASTVQTVDGGYIMVGRTNSNDGDVSGNHGDNDAWVVKLNATGSIEWQKCLGGLNLDWAYSVEQTNDGGYIVAGMTGTHNTGDVSGFHGSTDSWVIKLNQAGTIEWQKCLGGQYPEEAFSIQQTSDNGYIVAGYAMSNDGDVSGNHGQYDIWVVKLNSMGNLVWQKCIGGADFDGAHSVKQTIDGGFILAGFTSSNDGDISGYHGGSGGDYLIAKLNQVGEIEWLKCFGGSDNDEASSIQETVDGGFIVAGYTNSIDGDVIGNHGIADIWILKLNSSGNIEWKKCIGGSYLENYTPATGKPRISIQQTTDQGFIVSGETESIDGDVLGNHGGLDIWVVKLNPEAVGLIEELNNPAVICIKIMDISGRETDIQANTLLFYQYNDGTVEKKVIIE
jgi:hypothetical protein